MLIEIKKSLKKAKNILIKSGVELEQFDVKNPICHNLSDWSSSPSAAWTIPIPPPYSAFVSLPSQTSLNSRTSSS